MTKATLLLLIIFANTLYAHDFRDQGGMVDYYFNTPCERDFRHRREVKDYYLHFLLRQWQESTDWQEQELDSATRAFWARRINFSNIGTETIRKALKEYYDSDLSDQCVTSFLREAEGNEQCITIDIRGEQREYVLVRARELPSEKEQIWFLFARTDRRVLATHRDTITSAIKRVMDMGWLAVEDTITWEIRRKNMDISYYRLLLRQWESDSIELHNQRGFSRWLRGLTTLSCTPHIHKSIDSATAIAIAVRVLEVRYRRAAEMRDRSKEISVLGARLVGDSEEYWIVYCYRGETEPLGVRNLYEKGDHLIRGLRYDDPLGLIAVLISREKGQVLAIVNR